MFHVWRVQKPAALRPARPLPSFHYPLTRRCEDRRFCLARWDNHIESGCWSTSSPFHQCCSHRNLKRCLFCLQTCDLKNSCRFEKPHLQDAKLYDASLAAEACEANPNEILQFGGCETCLEFQTAGADWCPRPLAQHRQPQARQAVKSRRPWRGRRAAELQPECHCNRSQRKTRPEHSACMRHSLACSRVMGCTANAACHVL